MKPNFALDFRNDAITLLHRTARGWQVVGQTAVDTPDLAEALSFMRATALGLSPSGMTTKLVIPNSQVLYTRVNAPAADAGRRRKQVARALEGATPYAVADIAFDTSGTRPDLEVAVIAKETLAEAEAFAKEHRFNPVSFVAVPDHATFTTEPWFGPTSCADEFLSEGQRVERDPTPLALFNREQPVEQEELFAEPTQADRFAADDQDDQVAVPAHEDKGVDAPANIAPAPFANPDIIDPVRVDDGSETPGTDSADPVTAQGSTLSTWQDHPAEPSVAAPLSAVAEPVGDKATLEPEEVLAQIFAAEADASDTPDPVDPDRGGDAPAPDTARPVSGAAPDPMQQPDQTPTAALFDAEEAPMALDVVDDPLDQADHVTTETMPAAVASVLDTSIDDDLPPLPSPAIMVAFGSRRALEASAKEAAARSGATRPAATKPGGARPVLGKPQGFSGVTATRSGPSAKVTMLAPRPEQSGAQSGAGRLPQRGAIPLSGSMTNVAKPIAKTASKPSAASKALRGLGALVTAPSIAGAKERRAIVQTITPPTGPSSAASAAAATLIAAKTKPLNGGLGGRGMPRAKPRYMGLILTGILLVFLALVAAWATLFLEARNTGAPDPAVVVDAAPTPEDEMLADMQDPSQATVDPATSLPPVSELVLETAAVPAETVASTDAQTAATAIEPAPISAVQTETAAAPSLASDPQDEIFLAAMDAPPAMQDALSLPQPSDRVDAPPAQAVPPPPFGTLYAFDANGLIVATSEGVLTPEGVLVFSGRPKLDPPARPATLTPPSEAAAGDGPVVPGPVADPVADPALAAARPRPRPADLAPPTQNADDDASLAPAEDSRFASLRPRTKPAALIAAAQAAAVPVDPVADLGAQGASLTAQANATAAALSPLALAVSRKPEPRPQDMSRAVDAAVAVASRQPNITAPVEETAKTEDPKDKTELEADDEPELATAMPRLPTKTTVAKQATYVNAINLSKVNLIGVYGTQSNRYALIRQTNGRYKKVKVGDSFDGGRVAAITTSEVRYQKSGRMVTLALPKS